MSRYNYRENTAGTLDSTHIYYNINYANPNTGTGVSADGNTLIEFPTDDLELNFNFNQSRASAYLQCPEDYYLSVVRFTIESPNIPLFCVQPILGSMDPNDTIYYVTIMEVSTNIPYSRSVRWVPQDLDPNVTPPPVPIQQSTISPTDPYYYCNSYTYFVECINATFKEIWTQDLGQTNLDACPYVYYDAKTNLFQLGAVLSFRTNTTGVPLSLYSIFFNTPLFNLMSSLPSSYVAGTVNVSSGYSNLQLDYRMILSTGTDVSSGVQPYITNIRLNPRTNNVNVFAVQEYSTLSLWTPVQSIVLKTSLLTTRPEIIGTPVVYSNNSVNINAARQNADILNILSDDFAPVVSGNQYKPFIYYQPTGEYKLTELYGWDPIQAIDISAFWRDKFGNLIPFKIGLSCSATIKILFRKKTFNSDKF